MQTVVYFAFTNQSPSLLSWIIYVGSISIKLFTWLLGAPCKANVYFPLSLDLGLCPLGAFTWTSSPLSITATL